MKKVPFIKRLIVLTLCVGMVLGGNVSTLATEVAETQTSEEKVYTYEDSEISVEATAESDVLPSDAKLEVTPITEGTAYEEVEAQLESDASENDYEVAGFLAYDIRFVDQDGNEIEPEGSVAVSMEYKSAAFPEGLENAAEASVSVMHLEESDDAVAVKDLTADSTVNTTEDNAVDSVEFVTESFSTFTITWYWTEVHGWGLQAKANTTYITQVDEKGMNIGGNTSTSIAKLSAAIDGRNNISTAQIGEAHPVDGYKYSGAYVYVNYSEKVYVTDISYNANTMKIYYSTDNQQSWNAWMTHTDAIEQDTQLYLEYAPVKEEMLTVDTLSKGVDLTLYDYKVNSANDTSEAITSPTEAKTSGDGINQGHYLKFMNHAESGKPDYNKYTGGSVARQGIVASNLGTDGYPMLNGWGESQSLAYLFDKNDIQNVKKVYSDCNYLFYDEDGYFSYDSAEHFATIAGNDNNNFAVLKEKGSGFFPFTSISNMSESKDTINGGDSLGSTNINHYFGLTMSTDFIQTKDGKINDKDMVFEFSGDDDVWVFIDGKLVLDIGGIHGTVSGSINFSTGEAVVNSGDQKIVKKFTEIFDSSVLSEKGTFEDYSTHTMKFYYLERGHHDSNCKIKFNLQTIPKGSLFVSKNATETEADDTSDYEFVVKDANGTALAGAAYTLNTDSTVRYTDTNGKFTLKSGEYAVFSNLSSGNYSVTETGVLNSKYSLNQFSTKVSVNGAVQTIYNADSTEARTAIGAVNDAASTRFEFKNILNKTTVTDVNSELSKVIKYNKDEDDYNLTLSFKGPEETVTTTVTDTVETTKNAKLDIVLVFDTSGSMRDGFDELTKMTDAKKAANGLVDAIAENENVEANWKLINFSDWATLNCRDGSKWVSSKDMKDYIEKLEAGSGTNYQAALAMAAKEIKQGAREDAQQIVIFVTDGEPTYYLRGKKSETPSNSGSKLGGPGNAVTDGTYNGAIMGAKAVQCDSFYSIGIGFKDEYLYTKTTGSDTKQLTASDILQDVTDAVNEADTENVTIKKMYETKISELAKTFSNIVKDIESTEVVKTETKTYYSSNVTITDKLSQYVDIVEGSTFQISVKDQDGNEVGTPTTGKLGEENASYKIDDQTLTASYNNKTVVLDFPDNYELSKGYTYSVTFKVVASEKAYEEYAKTGYPHTGEEGTDAADNNPITSSGKSGFRSNDEAKVSYTFKGNGVEETYKHPVVQVRDRYSWKLVKASATNNDLKLAGAKFRLYDGTTSFYGVSGSDGVVAWYSDDSYAEDKLVKSIPDGTYSLKEIEAPTGYTVDTTEWNITVSKAVGLKVNTANGKYDVATDLIKEQNGKDFTQTLIFEDEAVYSLPETGGCGMLLYTFTGMLMMMGGALYLFLIRRKSYRVK